MALARFGLTIAVALAGGWIGEKLRLPAGNLMGAIVGVAAVNLLGGSTLFFPSVRILMQVLTGLMIGSKIGRTELIEMKVVIKPLLFSLSCMIILNLTFGSLMYLLSSLDLITSLFASVPGGVTDMVIISREFGANTVYVGLLQLFRILVIYGAIPPLFRAILAPEKTAAAPTKSADAPEPPLPTEPFRADRRYLRRFFIRLLAALAGGLFCRFLGIPAGAMTGSMVISAFVSIKVDKVVFPPINFYLKAMAGAYVAADITRESLATFGELLIPLIVMAVGLVVFTLGMGFGMHKLFGTDLALSLLASTPGGIQEMCLLSEDLGADTPKVAVMHTLRFIVVLLIFPIMIRIISVIAG